MGDGFKTLFQRDTQQPPQENQINHKGVWCYRLVVPFSKCSFSFFSTRHLPSIKEKHGLWCGHICQRKSKVPTNEILYTVLLVHGFGDLAHNLKNHVQQKSCGIWKRKRLAPYSNLNIESSYWIARINMYTWICCKHHLSWKEGDGCINMPIYFVSPFWKHQTNGQGD